MSTQESQQELEAREARVMVLQAEDAVAREARVKEFASLYQVVDGVWISRDALLWPVPDGAS